MRNYIHLEWTKHITSYVADCRQDSQVLDALNQIITNYLIIISINSMSTLSSAAH